VVYYAAPAALPTTLRNASSRPTALLTASEWAVGGPGFPACRGYRATPRSSPRRSSSGTIPACGGPRH
jgi:hypothetical protein